MLDVDDNTTAPTAKGMDEQSSFYETGAADLPGSSQMSRSHLPLGPPAREDPPNTACSAQ